MRLGNAGQGMAKSDINLKILYALERIAQAYRVMLWNAAKMHKLSPLQVQILLQTHGRPGGLAKVTELANTFDLSKATVSDAVKVLLRKKLIHKSPCSDDQRSYEIALSAKGEQLATQLMDFNGQMHKAVYTVTEEERFELFLNLSRIIQSLYAEGIISVQRMCLLCVHFRTSYRGHSRYCHLLQQPLEISELRLDCHEFEAKLANGHEQ